MSNAFTPTHDLDLNALQHWLTGKLDADLGPLQALRLSGGQSNPTYRLTAGDRRYVLRRKPSGTLLPSAHAIDREFRIIKALEATEVPVPGARVYCDDPSIIGAAFYVMDCVEGRIFWDPTLPELSCDDRRAAWQDFGRVVAALHRVDPASVGLADFGRPEGYVSRQISRLGRQYTESGFQRIEAMDCLIGWLKAHSPIVDETAIVHGDLRMDNLIFHPDEPRILAVLDWELSTLGHPLADFAYHMLTWRLTQAQFRGMAGRDLAALCIPGEREYLDAYCCQVGREPVDPLQWKYFLVFAMFRLAAILHGIARRAMDGTASNATARETGALARPIAEAAVSLLEID
ncbi:phosphotransferase family protein [Paucibacter sp. R3-3]|uniref:Phosphotransferase family protein n=1 Tax=Roseateles agri TaxID=3098619 RepID=A0ABU5DS42_9BURK|nr:phosphotransferase family protein [Paucibacter sp. R3-3]MDY0748064.1 phosphotransferase family protein [Paucibacter sp. R3-3]